MKTCFQRCSIAVSFFLAFVSCAAMALEYDLSMPAEPAMLTDKHSSLQNRIQFPNMRGDVFVLVLCNSTVDRYGKFGEFVYCYRDGDIESYVNPVKQAPERLPDIGPDVEVTEITGTHYDFLEERFEREVVEAARTARLEPARLHGKRVKVKVNFSVLFQKQNGQESIEVFLHHFRNEPLLGRNYIAAQRFYEQKRYFEDAEPNECPRTYEPIWIRSIIVFNGSAYNVAVDEQTEKNGASEESLIRCMNAYRELVKDNLHVPTIWNDRYVSGYYVELFFEDPVDRHAEVDTSVHDRVQRKFGMDGACESSGNDIYKEIFGDKWRGAESARCSKVEEDRYDDFSEKEEEEFYSGRGGRVKIVP